MKFDLDVWPYKLFACFFQLCMSRLSSFTVLSVVANIAVADLVIFFPRRLNCFLSVITALFLCRTSFLSFRCCSSLWWVFILWLLILGLLTFLTFMCFSVYIIFYILIVCLWFLTKFCKWNIFDKTDLYLYTNATSSAKMVFVSLRAKLQRKIAFLFLYIQRFELFNIKHVLNIGTQ